MLNIAKHDIILKQILRDIYTNPLLQGQLIFKGGTCLYIFYDLKRFSTDLDFDTRVDSLAQEEVTNILAKYTTVEDFSSKRYTWFWLGSYEKGLQKIKIEVSKRHFPNKFVNNNYYGMVVPVLSPECMFAHKLCAITERKKLQNRDLFDSWFMFNKQWEPDETILKVRTGKSKIDYYKLLIDYIKKNTASTSILSGLGEVLDSKQKNWVKEHLLDDLLFQLNIRIK